MALAKLFSWVMVPLSVASAAAGTVFFLKDRRAALLCTLILAGVPALWMQSLYAYNDGAMMLYAFLLFLAFRLWTGGGLGQRRGFICGLMMAALVSIKYFTFIPCLILMAMAVFDAWRTGRPLKTQAGAWLWVLAVAVGSSGFWYLQSWVFRGNPIYPFAAGLFGGSGFPQRMVGFAEIPKSLWSYLALPWNAAMRVDVFGGEPLGCLFLVLLPLAVFLKRAEGIVRAAALFSFVFLTAWFATIQHARFFFPVLCFLAFVFSALLARWWTDAFGKRVWALFGAGLFLAHSLIAMYYIGPAAFAAAGMPSADTYLVQRERSYPLFRKLSEFLKPEDGILSLGETRLFYAPCRIVARSRTLERLLKSRGLTLEGWMICEGIRYVLISDRLEPAEDIARETFGPDWRKVLRPLESFPSGAGKEQFMYSLWTAGEP